MELFSIRKDKRFKKEEKNAIIVIKVSLLRAILKALFIFQWLMFIKGLGTSQVSGKAARGGKDAASGAASASRPLRALGLGLGAGTRLCVCPQPGLERGCTAHHALAPLMTVPRSRREHRELGSSQCDPAV